MVPARRRKLLLIFFVFSVISIAASLILYALRQNISLFYTPTQMVDGESPLNHTIRVGGMVEKGSLVRAKKGLKVQFKITDFNHSILVTYHGILPDLFRDGQGIVAEGKAIDSYHFNASQVLAKHDANYMPPQVKAALGEKVGS